LEVGIELYTPHHKQKNVHKELSDGVSKYVVVNAGRQSGKSKLCLNQALAWLLEKPNVMMWYVLPFESQSLKVYKDFCLALKDSPIVKSKKGSSGSIEIRFINGSVIEFKSANAEHALRGSSLDYLILDEAAFIKESTIQEVLLPTLTVRGKKCLIVSTPKGKNWFYDYYMKGKNPIYPQWSSFKFTSLDNPRADQSFIVTQQIALTPERFSQEYLGEFVDGASVFSDIESYCIINPNYPPTYRECYMGIDLGLRGDSSVITILNERCEMVYQVAYNQISSPDLKSNIVESIKRFKPKKIVVEQNGLGLPIIDDLKIEHRIDNLIPFVTTNESKDDIISKLVNTCRERKIKLFNCQDLISELMAFEWKNSSTGKMKYGASDGFNDDRVMSLAFALHCFNKYKFGGAMFFRP
jgi:hypothetical protein